MISNLKVGDEIKIVAPSSYIEDESLFIEGVEILKEWGLKINYDADILTRKFGSLAGDDFTRFSELEKSQDSKLIIFAKGGWGAARLLEKNPSWKNCWMLGFSDTCSLLLSKYKQGFIGSIHGPMITTLSKEPLWSLERLHNLLFEGYVNKIQGMPLKGGISSGEIIVSNLTILSFLVGTDHFPDLKGKILILEDINEDLYKIDRMFTYLRMSKKFKDIIGLGFGSFFDNGKNIKEKVLLKHLIYERFGELNIPIVINFPIGHNEGNACIPLGFNSTINGNNGNLSINLNLD